MWSSVILLTVSALLTSAQNDFDAIQGCKQYTISRPSYNSPNPYYALDQFQDLQQVEFFPAGETLVTPFDSTFDPVRADIPGP
ncbi:conserved hypothetical protein [Culex quinquefasciatus]|uniref:Uncharacterized protein n=1 Tax=Culex quinquefasciatus TaxID=7176 RepID=B0WTY8_CULQU|nr:conserved hypothetical protein [Culex quinquefasciatus]|eukprot:XP_001856862.1 conserved hypothetical protein [Culex quinquefasciatus]